MKWIVKVLVSSLAFLGIILGLVTVITSPAWVWYGTYTLLAHSFDNSNAYTHTLWQMGQSGVVYSNNDVLMGIATLASLFALIAIQVIPGLQLTKEKKPS